MKSGRVIPYPVSPSNTTVIPNLYFNIVEANQEGLKDPDKLKIGQKLKVPPLEGLTSYVPPLD
jgi:hypothetical protein